MSRSMECSGKNIFTSYQTALHWRLCWPERGKAVSRIGILTSGNKCAQDMDPAPVQVKKKKLQKMFCWNKTSPKKRCKFSWNKKNQPGQLAA